MKIYHLTVFSGTKKFEINNLCNLSDTELLSVDRYYDFASTIDKEAEPQYGEFKHCHECLKLAKKVKLLWLVQNEV